MSVRASILRSEFPPYLKGGRPSCAPPPAQGGRASPPAQAVRSPAAPPPVAGEHLFELRLNDEEAMQFRNAMRVSGLDASRALVAALRIWAAEPLGLVTIEGDVTRVPDGEGGR